MVPRHLAGDDGIPADPVAEQLTAAGWSNWTNIRGAGEGARSSVIYLSPTALCAAEWVLADYPMALGELPVAWQVSARADTDSAVPEWSAYFTTGVPHETVADFLLALDARSDPVRGCDAPETVLAALTGQGWVRDADHPRTTAFDNCFVARFTLAPLPDLLQGADLEAGLSGWQAWAEPVLGASYVWCAAFTAATPHELVAEFASSLASPVPVWRQMVPEGVEGWLTLGPPL